MAKQSIKPGLQAASTKRAVIYLRQSLDMALRKGERESGRAVARQRKDCLDYIKRRGWILVGEYDDNDRSASRGRRKSFEEMVRDGEAGQFDVVVAQHLDRLTRSIRDYLPLCDLATKHGVGTITVSGELDLTTDAGRMVAGILALVAEAEVRRKGARQARANDQRADEGKPLIGGGKVLGYEADRLTVVPREAQAIHQAYADLLAGRSCSAIARDLNELGMLTHARGPWTHNSVSTMLKNPRYAAQMVHRGQITGPAKWDAIVDESTWRAACVSLADASRRTNPHAGGTKKWLGTSVYRCGVCAADGVEETVTATYRGDGTRVYQCRRSKHLTRAAEVIDEYVIDAVVKRLQRQDARELLVDHTRPDAAALAEQAQRTRDKLLSIQAAFDDDEVTETQYRVGSKRAKARLAEIEEQMSDTSRANALSALVSAEDVEAEWEGYDVERQKSAVRALCTVTLHKGSPGGNARGLTRKPLQEGTVTVDFQRQSF